MGSNNKSQKGYIATEDNFICNELSCKILNSTTVSVTNISATTITTKSLSSGSPSEFLYIPELSSYNIKTAVIHNDDKPMTFRSDVNFGAADKKININFSYM